MSLRLLIGVLAASLIGACSAESDSPASAAQDTVDETVAARVESAFRGVTVTSIEDSDIAGVRQVTLNGGVETVYVTDDGRHMFTGTVYEFRDGKAIDLSDLRYQTARQQGIEELDANSLITYPAEEERAELYVFTDISCGYCRRFHQHMDEYNELGITVHYLAWPRAGVSSPVGASMSAIWCDADPEAAMTAAKLTGVAGKPADDCEAPVASHFDLGRRFGVRGTPAVFTPDGIQMGGYVPPAELAERLDLQ